MAAVQASQKENRPANAAHGPMFSSGELKMMLGQCLKMASENKITASNTWGLPLIEHLDDLIKEDDPNKHTNFQRASVTLDAGVKIYSYRVDSVHTETFKILGGLGRASGPGEEGEGDPGDGGVEGENVSPSKRKRRGELNPEATLEPTLEALNIKKFDLAFAVDPLFHKTSAQFDEGGAKGLLLNNLSVYRGCEIVFDSMDVPEAAVDEASNTTISSARVDLDVVKPQLEAVLHRARAAKSKEERLTPTLDDILSIIGTQPGNTAAVQADEFVKSVAEGSFNESLAMVSPKGGSSSSPGAVSVDGGGEDDENTNTTEMMQTEEAGDASAPYADDDFGGGYDGGYDEYDDNQQQNYFGGGDANEHTGGQMQQHGEGLALAGEMPLASSSLQEDAISWLISAGDASGSSYVTASKGWAGASHWRYRAVPQGKDSNGTGEVGGCDEEGVDQTEFAAGYKKRGGGASRKRNEPLDFVALMAEGAEEPEFEMLPRGNSGRKRSTRTKTVAKTLLPEDYHYTSEFLGRYALRPRTAVAIVPSSGGGLHNNNQNGGGGDFTNNGNTDGFNDFGSGFDDHGGDNFGDDGNGGDAYGGEWDGGAFASAEMNVGDDLDIAQASHRVEKVEVNYSRAAKQVDVRYLKELMWNGIQTVVAQHGGTTGLTPEQPIEFADILATVPENNPAGRIEDLSIHLCFICVLHLANEHGLVVRGVPELNKMQISNIVRVSV
jgi:condensin complex subunit 2